MQPVTDDLLNLLPCDFLRAGDRDDWLAKRSALKTVGASDIASVLGVSTFRTALELWMVKTGAMPRPEADNLMRLGLAMQPAIATIWAEDNAVDLIDFDNVLLHRGPMSATLDYATGDTPGTITPVEVKRITAWQRKEWRDEPPAQYIAQVQQQMAVTGAVTAWLVAMIGDDLRAWLIERDDEAIAEIETAAAAFLDQVDSGNPPMPDFEHPTTVDILRSIPGDPEKVNTLGSEAAAIVDNWLAAKVRERDAKACVAANESRILHELGETTTALLPDGRKLVRKLSRNSWRLHVYQPKRRRR